MPCSVNASSAATYLRVYRYIRGRVALGCGGGGKSRVLFFATLLLLVTVLAFQCLQCHNSRMATNCGASKVSGSERREGRLSVRRGEAALATREMQLHIAARGQNIKVGKNTEVHVMSAINRQDYPVPDAFNIVLIAWVDKRRDLHNFVCCFANSNTFQNIVQAPAKRHYIDERMPSVPMRYALFACTIDHNLDLNKNFRNKTDQHFLKTDFKYVAFSEKTCRKDMTLTAHEIVKPEEVGGRSRSKYGRENNVGVCLKVAYGELSPQRLVEWFEFAKMIGVAVVHVYYHIVNEEAMVVFKYYEDTGFAVLSPIIPAVLKGHPPRGFQRPRWERQAWMDGAVACNHCLHRLHRYPFIAILDFDELLVPLPPYGTLPEVMEVFRLSQGGVTAFGIFHICYTTPAKQMLDQDHKATMREYPQAGAFFIDSYIVVLDWPVADNTTSVSFLRHRDRTVSNRLDNSGYGKSSPKVIVLPDRVMAVSTHDFTARGNYPGRHLPGDRLSFLHYRTCKRAKWNGCDFQRTRDRSLLRFQSRWTRAISGQPLVTLGCGRQYALAVKVEALQGDEALQGVEALQRG